MCSRLTSPLGRDDLGISLLGLTSEKPRHKVRLALGKVVGGGGAACLGFQRAVGHGGIFQQPEAWTAPVQEY